ncbi:hypothetical protein H072_4693 [Dactylellina haptotyla CBS 200.50]|uniref:Polarized growth protein Boi2 n=1 Tax=Dactylellina haptotyla (strain CBS 200.50) TaxID=1284197 RepID=S8C1F9_DACHA|nr:hypothetical protein H072_4693 [Dactylellina haptotyla CBS 200.50]
MAEHQLLEYLRVLHDFDARSPDELSLKKNAKIELLERDEEYNDGWFLGRDPESGKVGLFPQGVQTHTPLRISHPRVARRCRINQQIAHMRINIAMPAYGSAIDFESLRVKIRQNILFGANSRRSSAVYTTKWPTESGFAQTGSSVIDKQVAPDSDATVPPPAYVPATVGTKQEIPQRLSVTPSELTLDDVKFGGSTVATETPPLTLENNSDKRRVSDDFKRDPHLEKLSRSPVVEDTLSDIEEALSEIRTAPRSHTQKAKQHPPIMEAPEPPQPSGEHEFDDSASDYSRSAFGNESSLSLGIANQPSVSSYLEPRSSYTVRSRDSVQQQPEQLQHYPHNFEAQSSSEEDDDVVEMIYSIEEVRLWTPAQVSAYFQEQHLPLNICDKFEEQEISGSILLQLEMAHLKELEIGSFGKRFEVWKEIEKLQTMVKGGRGAGSAAGESPQDKKRNRSSSTPAGVLPRLPSLHNRPPARGGSLAVPSSHEDGMYDPMGIIRGEGDTDQRPTANVARGRALTSPTESPTAMSPDYPNAILTPKSDVGSGKLACDPLKETSRGIHHLPMLRSNPQRRPVHLDGLHRPSIEQRRGPQRGAGAGVHGRDPSFDRNWTLKGHKASESSVSGRRFTGDSGFASQSSWSVHANDRSNYVAGEDGGKRDRNVLHKKSGSSGSHGHGPGSGPGHHHIHIHGKKSSYTEEQRTRSGNNTPTPTSTPSSPQPFPVVPPAPSSPRGAVSKQTFAVPERPYETAATASPPPHPHPHPHPPHVHTHSSPLARDSVAYSIVPPSGYSQSPASIAYHNTVKGRKRSTSEAQIMSLDGRARDSIAPGSVMPGGKTLSVERPPPPIEERHVPPNIQTKANHPQRSVSDGAEKAMAMSPMSQDTSSTLLSPNGSEHSTSIKITIETPERKSDESKQRNGNIKDKKLRSVASASGIRQKSKKQNTSAYLEGLREVTPSQAAEEADFSGWMKKRGSSAVVATWKSRFFVLKGRRLSYFYSMDDTKERGLIDITSHRVLPAADDRLVSLHASVAAITSSTPASQASSANPGNNSSGPHLPPTPPSRGGGWFTFKLVPPAPGAAKGVMFTPPKLHYFATDSKQIGREWMAAFMKATIDRDESAPVISTFSANTISLAKARAMRARPPGFGESNTEPKPSPVIGLPIMSSQGSFNDSIESALAERHLIDDDAANAADDER